MQSRTRRVLIGLTGALALALTGCSAGAQPDSPSDAFAGTCADVDLSTPPETPIPLALGGAIGVEGYAGWFMMDVSPEEYHPNAGVWYELENQPFPDPAQRVSALQSGQIDGMLSSMPQILTLGSAGIQAKVVASMSLNKNGSPSDQHWVSAAGSDIKDFGDAAGKTIGVIGLGTGSELLARIAVEAAGVDPDDVTYVNVPAAQQISSLESGAVDIAHGVDPFVGQALNAGSVQDLGSYGVGLEELTGVDFTEPVNLVISDQYLNEHPEAVCAYLEDYRSSLSWLRDDLGDARQVFIDSELVAIPADVYKGLPPTDWPEGDALPPVELYVALAPYAEKYGFVPDGSEQAVSDMIWSGLGPVTE